MFNMSKFIPNEEYSRSALIFCFHLKTTAAELYRLLQETYGEYVPLQETYERWLRRFKDGNIEVADKERGKPPKNSKMWNCKRCWMKMIRKHKHNFAEQLGVSQQTVSNRLREMGKIQKTGRWVPHELNDLQMEMHKNTYYILLDRYKR